jgi:predicted ATPase
MPDNWDDYSFKTSFIVFFNDEHGEQHQLGTIKIGFANQAIGWTYDSLPEIFPALGKGWFSLGQDIDYYRKIYSIFDEDELKLFLTSLQDVAAHPEALALAKEHEVFNKSLMRGVSYSVIHGQYQRAIQGEIELTEFRFKYVDHGSPKRAPISLEFMVDPGSKPSTNIHVLIGRNGVGKTTLLNNMVDAIINSERVDEGGKFFEMGGWYSTELSEDYFSSVVSVSFSAFDPFVPPVDQPDRSKGIAYFYIGMRRSRKGGKSLPPKDEHDLHKDLLESLRSCLSQPEKSSRWVNAIKRLESDANFAEMDLTRLAQLQDSAVAGVMKTLSGKMSSGHSIVLLTITKLVNAVEEKTLVLMDEPESHLHPPLLSAFTRALSELLHDRNAVSIIATHSPVVLQEVPKSCVWKMTRMRLEARADRPERETFGENVGVLTKEVFGLEVIKSGFHDVLQTAVEKGGTFEGIMDEYDYQLGFEAQAILRAMINARDSGDEL